MSNKIRYKITIEYDGSLFAGWQRQKHALTIQEVIEEAIFKISHNRVSLCGAGRTDAGVHATAQVAHFDLSSRHEPHKLARGINHFIAKWQVAIIDIQEVPSNFHARISAISRQYQYHILCRKFPPALERNRVWHIQHSLDVQSMRKGALYLLGTHDLTTFRSSKCQAASPVKTIDTINIIKRHERIIIIIKARSFLHQQVRSITGSLKLVGEHKWNHDDILKALNAQHRSACAPLAPPDGLYLSQLHYP